MARRDKTLDAVLGGKSDANIRFSDLCGLLKSLNFDERVKGSHHIFSRVDIAEIINIRPKAGKAKPYQVKQVRNLIVKYKLVEGLG